MTGRLMFLIVAVFFMLVTSAISGDENQFLRLNNKKDENGQKSIEAIENSQGTKAGILLQGDCSDYIDLSGQPLPISVTGTTAGATNDYGPFDSWPSCWRGNWDTLSNAGPDITYKWTAPADGRYTISLCGSSYDTGLLLYNFTCPTEPSYPEDFICGNDDFCGIQSALYCMEFLGGQEILIIVDGYVNSAGNYQLNISEYQPSADLATFIDSTMQSEHIPGLSACAIRNGEVIWSGNYGYANIDQNIVPTDSTLFMLASISKTVVGIALMQLWEDSLFELDDDINMYLPWQVQNPYYPDSMITFKMLMTHTSSIIDNWAVLNALIAWGSDSPIPLGEFLENYLMPYGVYYNQTANFGNYQPGTVWNYCNVGAALGGYLVERINPDSLSFEDYCQEHIFAPLSMNNSSFFQVNLDMNNVAIPYDWNGYQYVQYQHYGYPFYPATQLRTSVSQLSRYLISFMQHGQIGGTRILDSTTVELMSSDQLSEPVWGGCQWGLFWFSPTWWGKMWGHSGNDYGARTEMYYLPEENTGAIVLTNGDPGWGSKCILHEIFEYIDHNVAVPDSPPAPNHFALSHNYPNPGTYQTCSDC